MPPIYEGSKRVIARYIGSAAVSSVMIGEKSCFAGILPLTGRTFLAKLKSSLILDEGAGGPTWSRATEVWRFNDQGYLRKIPRDCAEFGGARLVRNLCSTKSENFGSGYWNLFSATVSGTSDLTAKAGTATNSIFDIGTVNVNVGDVYIHRFRVQYVDIRYVQLSGHHTPFGVSQFCNFDLVGGTYNATGCTASMTLVSSGVWDISITSTVITASALGGGLLYLVTGLSAIRGSSFPASGTEVVKLIRYQQENVSGYDASYIPEYVSVGVVLSSPWHGAGVDGCKYFETDWQGAPIPAANLLGFRREPAATNNVLYSRDLRYPAWTSLAKTGAIEALTNGDFSAGSSGWTVEGADATHIVTFSGGTLRYQSDTTTPQLIVSQSSVLVVGETCTVTLTLSSYTSGLLKSSSFLGDPIISSNTSLTKTITGVATSANFSIQRSTTNVDVTIDSISVKLASVKCTQATGIDGIANTATRLTFDEANAVIKQALSGLGSLAARCTSAYLKLSTPFVGPLSMTQDDGATWTDVTSQLNSSTYVRPKITSVLANPIVGFKSGTAGDVVDIDVVGNESGTVATSPIVTTTAAIGRVADSLTYQTASNWSDTAGTAYVCTTPVVYSGGAVGSATNGLLLSTSNSGATAYDGTNSANGPTGTPGATEKLAVAWGSSAMSVASSGAVGTVGTYDGAMGLSSIGIGVGAAGYFGDVAVYNYKMTDVELQAITV